MAFDPTGTIGSRPCEVSLCKILAEKNDKKLIQKITKLLQFTRKILRDLLEVKELHSRRYLAGILRKHLETSITAITGSPVRKQKVIDPVTTHTMCCIHAYFQEFRQQTAKTQV